MIWGGSWGLSSRPAKHILMLHYGWIRSMPKILVWTLLTFLGSCATADYNYVPEQEAISEPPIGSVTTVYVGDSMIRQGTFTRVDAIKVNGVIDVGGYELQSGYYVKTGQDEDTETFVPAADSSGGAIKKDFIVDPPQAVIVFTGTDKICVVTIFSNIDCTNSSGFDRTIHQAYARDAFQQTLIYSGKVGDKINIGYREFSSDYARPAFNNDVEYDLSESCVIGYKGARLEILDATNESITFKLIRNFN